VNLPIKDDIDLIYIYVYVNFNTSVTCFVWWIIKEINISLAKVCSILIVSRKKWYVLIEELRTKTKVYYPFYAFWVSEVLGAEPHNFSKQ